MLAVGAAALSPSRPCPPYSVATPFAQREVFRGNSMSPDGDCSAAAAAEETPLQCGGDEF